MMMWSLIAMVSASSTWTTHSPFLPSFEFVVLDHADGNSMGYGVTVAGDYVFTSGSMKQTVRVVNPATGTEIESTNEGDDGDIYLLKVGVNGEPNAIWTYAGSSNEFPSHLASHGMNISMTGYFSGNISFGDYTFTNVKDPASRDRDGFVVKVDGVDGAVQWARHFEASAGMQTSGTTFDSEGNVAFTARRCVYLADGGEECHGVVSLLDAADGSTVWERTFGTAVGNLGDVVLSSDGTTLYAVGSLSGTVDFGGSLGNVSSASEGYSDALLLALNAADGAPTWAGLSTALSTASTSSSALVEAEGGFVWMACGGACEVASSTASTTTVTIQDKEHSGAVLKFDETTGAPIFAADVASALGMAVANGNVYVNTHSSSTLTFGDTTFSSMGSLDQYIMKVNPDGTGSWVLSQGGDGLEYVRRMTTDSTGDLYTIGLTQSNPSYFDPIQLTTHTTTDGYDVFVGKLLTSNEQLASCLVDETTVASDMCFVSNVCYASGEFSRSTMHKCRYCDPSTSTTSFAGVDTTNFCVIDDVCYASGEYRQLPAGFGTVDSDCEMCDPAQSTSMWSLVDGYVLDAEGACYMEPPCTHCGAGYNCYGNHAITCHAEPNPACTAWYAPFECPEGVTCQETFADLGVACLESGELDDYNCCTDKLDAIAGYIPSTDVSTHSMIDLDAKEIEEYSDAAEWSTALFVYENGGGGLCSEDDIVNAGENDSCYGKTTADAKGNSIKGSGEIRTIKGFATSGPSKMSEWPLYNVYRNYWNDDYYSDTFIQNALSATGAWSTRSTALRAELSAKGAKYQAVWMYVYHEMEDAVADCRAGDIFDNQASNSAGDAPHAWDEAWAFYAGSLEGVDGAGTGYLLYDLADKRCPQFGTCAESGTAKANVEALAIADAGLVKILQEDCDGVAEERDRFVVQMTIPPMQGMIRYLYLADPTVNGGTCTDGDCSYDKAWAEGWAFAAAVLPQIHECDSTVAQLVVDNINVDGIDAPMKDGYEYVKGWVETTYECMGISCADIGEYQDSSGVVYPGMGACVDGEVSPPGGPSSKKSKKSNKTSMIIIVVVVVVVVVLLAFAVVFAYRKSKQETPAKDVEMSDGEKVTSKNAMI